jgi:DnaJ-class molecular chaperone
MTPSAPLPPDRKPGDEVDATATQTGDTTCPVCGGSGKTNSADCENCSGTGVVRVSVGDA